MNCFNPARKLSQKGERIAVDYTKSSAPRLSQILNEDMKEYNEQCLKLAESHLSIEKANYLKLCAKYISNMIKYINSINRRKDVSSNDIKVDFQDIKYYFNVDDSLHKFCVDYVMNMLTEIVKHCIRFAKMTNFQAFGFIKTEA